MVEKSILEILSIKESDYLYRKYDKKFIHEKCDKMNSIAYDLENTKGEWRSLFPKEFEEIRKFAISKGGLMKNIYRREFYKKCFNLDKPSNSASLSQEFSNEIESTTWYKIIDLDVMRTIANHFFEDDENSKGNDYSQHISLLKTKTSNFLKNFFKQNYSEYGYEYFQGFHDITLYVILIFYNYENYGMASLKIIAESFLKDYMILLDPDNKTSHFRMEILFDILKEIITKIDKGVMEFLKENCDYVIPPSVLPWLITFFTHDIAQPFMILRILDYLLLSPPTAILHIVANVK